MKNLLVRAGLAVLGVVIMLTWWSFTVSEGESMSHIPAKVWEGGHSSMEVSVETSGPARVYMSFGKGTMDDGSDHKTLETWEMVGAGSKTWTIDVPALNYFNAGITAENPQVGATLKLLVRVNGRTVFEQSDTLSEPLRPNYAFGLQCEFEDPATEFRCE